MKWIPIIIILVSQVTGPQVQTGAGTVLFLLYSPTLLTVAADSRLTMLGGEHKDTECKISAFGNKFIFTMAGVVFTNGDKRNPHLISRKIWEVESRKESSAPALVLDVANKWASKMEETFADPALMAKTRKITGGEALATADFAATDRSGKMALASAEMHFDGPLLDRSGQLHFIHEVKLLTARRWYSAGRDDIVKEYMRRTSPRSQQFIAKLGPELSGLPPDESDARLARELIESSIALSVNKNDLAAPVDVVQLRPTLGVKWISLKPNCEQRWPSHGNQN